MLEALVCKNTGVSLTKYKELMSMHFLNIAFKRYLLDISVIRWEMMYECIKFDFNILFCVKLAMIMVYRVFNNIQKKTVEKKLKTCDYFWLGDLYPD